ncbi:MAG TPA: hypothetical protein VFB49_10165 [Patescibacteria group bacterium]|nr:hypothetical protein [Patescibacteria group bacterium]
MTPPAQDFGFDAPLLSVDRFSTMAATRLRRDRVRGLPGPNEPIHLDAVPFLLDATGPGGRKARCYDLDLRPARPARFYVFYDAQGNYVLTQFPIVDVAPGDPGYTDIWDLWKVTAPSSYRADNSLRDMKTLERLLSDKDSGYKAERTGALLNGPIVPEGSSASMKADRRDGAAALRYVWYRGQRAPYLYFEQTLRIAGDLAPVSSMKVATAAGPTTGAPVSDPLAGAATMELPALPGDPGYSPLRKVIGSDGRPLYDEPLNCPVVGP